MRILLTNDDGIQAPGLAALHRVVRDLGEVHVIAPAKVQSATSHAVTFHRPVPTRRETVVCKVTSQSFDGIAVDGRPADCVKLGLTYLVPQPVDLVLSGINAGANIGINVIYSGTVGAAREAAFIGVPAIAMSLHLGDRSLTDWDRAARHCRQVLDRVLALPLTPHTLLNVNIPILDGGAEPRGIKVVPVSISPILDRYHIRTDDAGLTHFTALDGFDFHHTPAGSDVHALFQRCITVTPMHFDPTHHGELSAWSQRLCHAHPQGG